MAHALKLDAVTGKAAMVYTGETPWHGLGTKFATPPSIEQVITELGCANPVTLQQLQLPNGTPVERWAAVRDGEVYGTHQGRYNILQDSELVQACEPLLAVANIETAGYLNHGARFFMCMRFTENFEAEVVKGDPVRGYALAAHGHDGTLSATMGLTSVRVVCANTLSAASAKGAGSLVKFRHTASVQANVIEAGQVLAKAHGVWAEQLAGWRYMAGRTMSRVQFKAFADTLLGVKAAKQAKAKPAVYAPPANSDLVAELLNGTSFAAEVPEVYAGRNVMPTVEELATESKRNVTILQELFESGTGNVMKGVYGTNWAAYNAITEFLTHMYGRGGEAAQGNRLIGNNYGLNANMLAKASNLLTR